MFPPSEKFAPYLANWIRLDPIKHLGEGYNINGLLARSLLQGSGNPRNIPQVDEFDINKVTYTKHFIGRTWNGDGLQQVLERRLKLESFREVKYTKNIASWLALKQGRRPSNGKLAVLEDISVLDDWKEEGKKKEKKSSKTSKTSKTKKNRDGEEPARGTVRQGVKLIR